MEGRTYPNWPLRNITLKHFHFCGHIELEDVLCWRAMACALIYSLASLSCFCFQLAVCVSACEVGAVDLELR
jgi:hypothetical protein